LAPHIEAAAVPELVRDTILRGDQLGAWSAARTTTPAHPAAALWELLLSQPSRPGNHAVSQSDARKLAEWLPASLRVRASELLESRQVIPQEALRFDVLAEALTACTRRP
jgi:hypothetical protein